MDIVSILERIGQDPQLRYASAAELDEALQRFTVDAASRAAILGERPESLEALLGAKAAVCCVIHAPDEEDDEDDKPAPDEKEDDGGEQR